MKKKERIKAYNKKYTEELLNALKTIKPYLIQAFTNFYGKEYYSYIKKHIENIYYVTFISHYLFKILNNQSIGISNKDHRVTSYYLKYLNNIESTFSGYTSGEELEKKALKKFITSSSLKEEVLIHNDTLKILEEDTALHTIYVDKENLKSYQTIFLPIFTISLRMIIHEINHSLMTNALAIYKKELITTNLFINSCSEDLFNDLLSYQVLEEYKKLKAPIPLALKRFNFINEYEEYFYVIKDFYVLFAPLIKKSIMTNNFNLLINQVGSEDFSLFCKLIDNFCKNKYNRVEQFIFIHDLTLKMYEHSLNISSIDYEAYFKELESKNIRVRRLKKEDL